MSYKLLDKFEETFVQGPYLHRNSTIGDAIAAYLYEDIFDLARSQVFSRRVSADMAVLNVQNKRRGVIARRGDGSFGEVVPGEPVHHVNGFTIGRAPIATIEIGVEVKILSKAMIKQIDRVISDLTGQVAHFKAKGSRPVTVGIVGINQAPYTIGHEGTRTFPTDGKKFKHPVQEADEAEARLRAKAEPSFDEFIVLRYLATNDPGLGTTYPFQWANSVATNKDYGAALARIGQRYQQTYGS